MSCWVSQLWHTFSCTVQHDLHPVCASSQVALGISGSDCELLRNTCNQVRLQTSHARLLRLTLVGLYHHLHHISTAFSVIGLCTSLHAMLTSGTYRVSSGEPFVHCDLFHTLLMHMQSGTYKGTGTTAML